MIAENTFFPFKGMEKGIIHYDFNKERLLKEVKDAGFRLINIRKEKPAHLLANFYKA